MTDDIRELTDEDFARAIPRRQRERIIRGQIDPEKDIVALRRFAGLTQNEFAEALGISVHTLRNWEQGRRSPEGPALALLRIAASLTSALRKPRSFVSNDLGGLKGKSWHYIGAVVRKRSRSGSRTPSRSRSSA